MEQLRNHKTKIIIGLSLLAGIAISCGITTAYVLFYNSSDNDNAAAPTPTTEPCKMTSYALLPDDCINIETIFDNLPTEEPIHELYQVCFSSPDSEGCLDCIANGKNSSLCNKCEDLFKQYVYEPDPISPFYKDPRYFDNENGRQCVDPDKYE